MRVGDRTELRLEGKEMAKVRRDWRGGRILGVGYGL